MVTFMIVSLSSSVFGAAQVRPVDGLVYPSAESGHGRVDSRKLRITAAVAPGDHAVDTSPTHQRPARVSLQGQDNTLHQLSRHSVPHEKTNELSFS